LWNSAAASDTFGGVDDVCHAFTPFFLAVRRASTRRNERLRLSDEQRMAKEFQQLEWNGVVEDDLRQLIRLAVREDLDRQYDWTTVALVDPDQQGRAAVVVRQAGVLSGLRAMSAVIDEMQAVIDCQLRANDGNDVSAGAVVAELSGSARDLLTCERPILNFLGRLSGIATITRQYVRRVEGTRARIYDTRKTTPGWRRLEKYAVRCGGGSNHRTGLFDGILIKDNHLALSSEQNLSPADAVRRAQDFVSRMTPELLPSIDTSRIIIEVEVDRLEVLDDVLAAGPDIVLLDNMPTDLLRAAVTRRDAIAPHVELEASGGVSLDTVRDIALSGVERISVGGLTHSAKSLDVAMDWLPAQRN
jgi:nicotinate-nucleotide pyrophosphorylase (carboxylating)